MKKKTTKRLAVISGSLMIIISIALTFGAKPVWLLTVLSILCLPVFVISLFLTWSAKDKEGDYPFIGY